MKSIIIVFLYAVAASAFAQTVNDASATAEGLKATADFKEGGRHGNGTVVLNGQEFNADDLVPAGDNQAYLDRLKSIDGRKNLNGLRDAYDELKPQIDKDPSSWAEATRTGTVTPKEMTKIEDDTKNDGAFWQSQIDAIHSNQGAAGELLQECTTKTVVTPGSKEHSYTEEKFCDLVNIPEDKQVSGVCQRQAEYTETPTNDRKEKTSQLFVTEEGNGTVCKRETKAENYRDTMAGTITSTIDITEETGGLSCRREIVPEATFQDVTGTKEATLPVDHQVPGTVCNVELWPTATDRPNNGTRTLALNVNNEVGGQVCTRTRVAIAGSSNSHRTIDSGPSSYQENGGSGSWLLPEPATATIRNMVATMKGGACNGQTYTGFTSVGWDSTYGKWRTNTATPPMCFDDIFSGSPGIWSLGYDVGAPSLSFALSESGNCNDGGTANCPAIWQCTNNAPTNLNGVAVSAGDVASLGALYPGAGSACVSAQKVRSCGGTANTSNEISFAADVSAAASTFSDFFWNVTNPQSGVTVTLTQTPTRANGWVARYNVARTDFGSTPASPQIFVSWKTATPNSNLGANQVGDCSGAAASPNCPTKWTCSATAPITINGILVSASDAATKAPLFPGAPSNCAKAQLDKVCSGTASLSSVVSIADKIPSGVTAIRDFKVTVKNPQAGVSVVLTSAPTFENAWNASFRVDRSSFSTDPANPQIIMTWGATVTVITSKVVDTGNCKDPGSTACPTRWTCDKTAPATVNDILVTAEMAKQYAPLFPGASNICAAGNLSRVCDSSSAMVSSIYIGNLLSKDSTEITNFVWKVNNPQSGILVELVDPPSLTNGWIARFRATRDYKVATNPQKPSLTLSWSYLSELKVRTSIITTGDCGDIYGGMASTGGTAAAATVGTGYAFATGIRSGPKEWSQEERVDVGLVQRAAQNVLDGLIPTADASPMLVAMAALAPSTCPVAWVCTKSAPGIANGIDVSVADLQQRGELYPSENFTCLDAEYRRTCSGAGANTTVVSIADQVPAGADKITNFGWHVIDPGKGVSIALIQTPAKDNGWKAIFQTTRTDWNVKAEQPTVGLAWDQLGTPNWDVNTSDQGDCSKEGDEFCQAEWFCVEKYPADPPVPEEVTSRSQTYKGADEIGVAINYNFSVASQMPAGTNAIYDFRIGSLTGTADVSVIVEPSKANGWVGTAAVTTKGYEYEYVAGKPLSRYSQATLSFTWKLGERPAYVAPPYRSQSPGPLFPGDDGSCKRAEKRYTCEKIWEGELCFTDVDGQKTCLDQPKTDGPPNDCGTLEQDKTCTEVREQCTEDGMSSDGHCYVSTKVFECKVTVVGDDATIDEETTCTGGGVTPCMDGNCVPQEKNTTSASTAAAHVTTMQTMLIDHDPAPSTSGKVSMNRVPSNEERRTQGMLLGALQKVIDGVVPSASAEDDPFGVPLPYPVPKEDPPGNPADALGPGVAEDMLSKMKFFVGTRESCKKMLGGLLDCCSKEPPDQQKEWWKRYGTFTRENGMSELLAKPDEQNGDGTGVWDNYNASSNSMTLNSTFTSIAENVKAGGTASGGSVDATLDDLAKQFQGYSDKEVKPHLGWYCKDHEKDLAIKKNLGQCTYIGSYCQTKGLLGECIVKQHVSCCFNSSITKLIRDKLAKEGKFGFGTAKHPSCDGIPLTALMQENMTDFNTDEVEARMAAGGFTPDTASLSSMSGEEFDVAMFGSGNSLNDPNRKGLTGRTEDRLEGMSDNMSAGFEAIGNSLGTRSNTTNTDVPDPESPGAITFNPGLYIVENGRVASVTVNRNGGKGDVSVTLQSVGGTASVGVDYPAVNTTLSWRAGEIGEKIVMVPITDRARSSMSTVELRIVNPTNGGIINPLTDATIEIQPTKEDE
ncbi:hypothetical protein NB700_001871 [Xanthomonas sacchari]|uniref:Calx-beta domain-containing protein n=1 Tax=Xanthomonas sacchari TaxID=56458 RepID=A0ABT3DUY7_9XANT|nr:conjugal transfer protein TraN [Xanthomonas sacchari]MCW0399315.1 hypothetical protein [Xanthomonas sacchari]